MRISISSVQGVEPCWIGAPLFRFPRIEALEEARDCNVGDPQVQRMARPQGPRMPSQKSKRSPVKECQNGFCMRRQWCPAENENWATTEAVASLSLRRGQRPCTCQRVVAFARRIISNSTTWSCGLNLTSTTTSPAPTFLPLQSLHRDTAEVWS